MDTPSNRPPVEEDAGLPWLLTQPTEKPGEGPEATKSTRRRERARGGRLLVVAVGIAVAAATWMAISPSATAPNRQTGPAAAAGPVVTTAGVGTVVGLGRLVPRSRIVVLAPPFGAADARIAELRAREGERVDAGAVLAVLDNEPALRSAVSSAAAAVSVREAGLSQARIAAAASRDDARSLLARAEAAIAVSQRDLDRAMALVDRSAMSEQVVDQRRLALAQATADAARARATLLRYDGPIETQVDVELARQNLQAARADAARAGADLERAIVRAPFTGTVLTLRAHAGERIGEGGIATFADLDDMVAEVEVYENHLRALSIGQVVTIAAVALPAQLTGHVSRIGAEILRQTLTDMSPAANTDSRVARISVELDAPAREIAARFPGLQVTAKVETGARQ